MSCWPGGAGCCQPGGAGCCQPGGGGGAAGRGGRGAASQGGRGAAVVLPAGGGAVRPARAGGGGGAGRGQPPRGGGRRGRAAGLDRVAYGICLNLVSYFTHELSSASRVFWARVLRGQPVDREQSREDQNPMPEAIGMISNVMWGMACEPYPA